MQTRHLIAFLLCISSLLLFAYMFRYAPPAIMDRNGVIMVWDRWRHRVCMTGLSQPILCSSSDFAEQDIKQTAAQAKAAGFSDKEIQEWESKQQEKRAQ